MAYTIRHHKLFEKEIVKLPGTHQQKIYRILTSLKEKPQKLPSSTKPLVGYKNVYRTRIGTFRLLYRIDHNNQIITVLGIGSRGKIYNLLRRLIG